jgi:hypothetical protein
VSIFFESTARAIVRGVTASGWLIYSFEGMGSVEISDVVTQFVFEPEGAHYPLDLVGNIDVTIERSEFACDGFEWVSLRRFGGPSERTWTLRNNWFRCDGIMLYEEATFDGVLPSVEIVNNTFTGRSRGVLLDLRAELRGSSDRPLTIANNLFSDIEGTAMYMAVSGGEHEPPLTTFTHNGFVGNSIDYARGTGPFPGDVTDGIALDDSTAPPSHAPGSTGIDAAAPGFATTDFHGAPRGDAPDMGAVESR